MSAVDRRTTSRRSPWRRRAIPTGSSSFLIPASSIAAVYARWSARGAQFLTPPKQHQYEIRCYIRDPDGHLIEVGQTTDPDGDWTPGSLAIEHARPDVRVMPRSPAKSLTSKVASRGPMRSRPVISDRADGQRHPWF